MEKFDPNGTGIDNGNYFGLPFAVEDSSLVLISAPWDVTASYGGGTCFAPDAIIEASTQLDLYDVHNPQGWKHGIGTVPIDYSIQDRSVRLREDAKKVMDHLCSGGSEDDDYVRRKIERVNEGSAQLNNEIYNEAKLWIEKGKIVGLVGGDHSTPFGLIRAVAEKHGSIGILHIDAHCDLRVAYEGFVYSHASIMYNVADKVDGVTRFVQVGVRDFCDSEIEMATTDPRFEVWSDYALSENSFNGMSWADQCGKIIDSLPQKVYVSFDIDGLSPDLCPGTGTPVAGGMSFQQAVYLLVKVVESGRVIVGFDLCEVAPGDVLATRENQWDANVGARVLYKLCNLALKNVK